MVDRILLPTRNVVADVSHGDQRQIKWFEDISVAVTELLAGGGGGGGGVTDGNKGQITVSGGGTSWTINISTVSLSNMANLPAGRIIGNNTGVSATPIALTAAQSKALLAILSSDISDFNAASRAQAEAALIAGTNVTITPAGSGATRTLTISASGGGGGSDSFETVNRNLAASDGTIAYSGGDIDTITYANGVVKTFAYGVDGLSTVTLSGSTPGGIDLIKTFTYTLGEFTGFAYS